MKVGVIGGTGVYGCLALSSLRDLSVRTPYGDAFMKQGLIGKTEVTLLYRHGEGHTVPPHKVNYRANIWALWWLGVQRVIGTAASGSLNPSMAPGDLVAVDQFIDFTRSRAATFFEGGEMGVVHTDVTDPYCAEVREALNGAARERDVRLHDSGCYVCTEGPRFETRAEIKAYRKLGGDLVGMTNVPEVVLAKEAGMCYGLVAIVTNFAAGISSQPLTHEEVLEAMKEAAGRVAPVIEGAVARLAARAPEKRECGCARNWGLLAKTPGGTGGLR
ncbi:MAG: S-methyl-5'-thioadenosine phosphorylase [Firmicutes bacterium]|nr:S-methyl-5'-thioadenosine phosphorylase [Bacillota bacterium]